MTRSSARLFVSSFFALGALVAVASASSACAAAADCSAICNRYQSCFDDGYDVPACEQRCRDSSDEAAFRARANECEACMNERDCINSAFNCASECSEVVP